MITRPASATARAAKTIFSVGVLRNLGASSATHTGWMKRKKVAIATPVVRMAKK